ncbi:MAG: tRNA (cytidine(34)-2'-O)-methyltransferase [Phycisphaerae bacterium]|nr:tRNA (cytidine(34)-2'-O)-methyltransferase [Phycisphaerae bacterium]
MPLFHVALHQPEIPNNTGNIGRTCVACACALHLIHPLGFELSEKACRRAGLDYWPRLDVREHADFGAYLGSAGGARVWVFTTTSARTVYDAELGRGDHLLFGRETAGLPREILERFPDRCVSFPMVRNERSLNLATAVCAAVYEGVRQLRARGEVGVDDQGRLEIHAKKVIGTGQDPEPGRESVRKYL